MRHLKVWEENDAGNEKTLFELVHEVENEALYMGKIYE